MSVGTRSRQPRIAIVHEWLATCAGSERVVEQLLQIFPNADLYATVDFLGERERQEFLGGRRPQTTFVQHLPAARKHFRKYLALMPLAVEQHDLSSYDVVISSHHAVAKGVLTGPDQLHISYVHSPIRYAWDLQQQYLSESGLTRGPASWLARAMLHYMRLWDVRTSYGVDTYVANSAFIARRIAKVYGRKAEVIYPPVDSASFSLQSSKEDFYLTASRMVPYKRVPLIVEAFAKTPQRKLVVIGDGPDFAKVQRLAAPNIELKGYQSSAALRSYMQRAKAFVFVAEEDFGITPVEAQACGTPVIAFGKGGVLESVRGLSESGASASSAEGPTGVFCEEQTVQSLHRAIDRFESNPGQFRPQTCRANAERFSNERFRAEIRALVEREWERKARAPETDAVEARGSARAPNTEGTRGA
jgi:glycosyltransferase involved in cell wall biosynthesis